MYTAIVIVVIAVLIILAFAFQYKKVGPNEALIISGGRKRKIKLPDGSEKTIGYRLHIGGGTFLWPLLEKMQILSLETVPIEFQMDDVIATNGIKCSVNGTAQIKIDGTEPAIHVAAEQFLGKEIGEVRETALKTIEGQTRSIIGTMQLEEINKNRTDFAKRLYTETVQEFSNMGLKLVTYNLRDIKDPMGYLEALGKPKIAQAKRNAEIAEAETSKEAVIKSSQAKKEGDVARLQADAEIAEAQKDFEMKRAEFQADINQRKATADFSYDLEKHKMTQLIKKEEYKVRVLEKEQGVELEKKEIERKERELDSRVRKPAEAERYRVEVEAEGRANAKRAEGEVEAQLTRLMGEAEAESMEKKAESWGQYNQAAVLQMLFNILPGLAKEISEPLSKVEKIVMVNSGGEGGFGASKVTGEVATILAQLPSVVEGISGVDLKKLLEKLPATSGAAKKEVSPSKEKGEKKQ
jgi:flotillin